MVEEVERKEVRIIPSDIDILWKLHEEENALTPYMLQKKMDGNKAREFYKYRLKKLRELGWARIADGDRKTAHELTDNVLVDGGAMFLKSQDNTIHIVAKPGSETAKKFPDIIKKLNKGESQELSIR